MSFGGSLRTEYTTSRAGTYMARDYCGRCGRTIRRHRAGKRPLLVGGPARACPGCGAMLRRTWSFYTQNELQNPLPVYGEEPEQLSLIGGTSR